MTLRTDALIIPVYAHRLTTATTIYPSYKKYKDEGTVYGAPALATSVAQVQPALVAVLEDLEPRAAPQPAEEVGEERVAQQVPAVRQLAAVERRAGVEAALGAGLQAGHHRLQHARFRHAAARRVLLPAHRHQQDPLGSRVALVVHLPEEHGELHHVGRLQRQAGGRGELRQAFTTNAELERFLVGSFTSDYARQVANGIGATLPVRANLVHVLQQFERVDWVTSLMAAAAAADPSNPILAMLLALMQSANQVKPTPPAAPAPTPAARPVTTASVPPVATRVVTNPRPAPAPEPKPVVVSKLLKPLGKEEQSRLVELLLVAFDRSGLNEIAYFDLGERLDNITAPGALGRMAGALVQWAVEQEGSVALLLNAMLTRRKLRTDIPAFVRQLEKDGFVTLAG